MLPTWTVCWSCSEILVKTSLRFLLAGGLKHLQLAMNTFLPNTLQYQINFPGGRYAPIANPFPQTAVSPFQIPPHILHSQFLQLQKAIPVGLLQQQFLQNFAFNSSERYHPKLTTPSKSTLSASQPDLCHTIKQEILKQLNAGGSADASREGSPIEEDYQLADVEQGIEDEELLEDLEEEDENSMHARGIKRQSDVRSSPYQKRHRSEERDLQNNSINQSTQLTSNTLKQHEYEQVTEFIWTYYQDHQQQQDLYVQKMKLRDALYAVMKGVFPYCGLYVVGSSMNGFGSHSSDMDLCLMLSHSEIDQKGEATEILKILYKSLRKCSFLKEINLIRAKVPILKFTDRISEVECDLNINNSVGIRNTHLLSAYSKLDWRVAPLILFIKHWAKYHNINDASQGSISSYSLVLMLLHYLQCGTNPPVLFSLQQKYMHKYSPSVDIRLLTLNEKLPSYTSPNLQPLGELFTGFLDYYANTFSFEDDAISVRLGCRLSRHVVRNQNPMRNNPSQWKCLCIEEPFDLSNTSRSVYDPHIFQRIQRVFRQSYARLRQAGNLNVILEQPM